MGSFAIFVFNRKMPILLVYLSQANIINPLIFELKLKKYFTCQALEIDFYRCVVWYPYNVHTRRTQTIVIDDTKLMGGQPIFWI